MKKPIVKLLIEFVITFVIYRKVYRPLLHKYFWRLYDRDDQIFNDILHTVLVVYAIYFISKCFYKLVIQNEGMRSFLKNLFTSLYFVVFLLLFLELIFTYVPKSQIVDSTLASKNWFAYYWKINYKGFRDTYFSEKDTAKKKIAFIGDSFTEGHGIKHNSERFSDVVGKTLADKYSFYNLGICGMNSNDEYAQLQKFPFKPDVVVLQYYGNDIEDLDTTAKQKFNFAPFADSNNLTYAIVSNSYLANYIFWLYPHGKYGDYYQYMSSLYNNPILIKKHLATLNKFVEYCRQRNALLIAVVIPFLQVDMKKSDMYMMPVVSFFKQNNIPVVNVAEFAGNFPVRERVVNSNDMHASVMFNKIIADSITNIINRAK
ncbi:MAG TPA: SGNH/GDSL hydrolase family protein [Bacteroidia bacterium]|nr:SGNH/GDSL hydrolase family protein [Bacteroidia bacterium]